MRVEEWVRMIKGYRKLTSTQTIQLSRRIKVRRWGEKGDLFTVEEMSVCDRCGRPILRGVDVVFHQPLKRITLFQAYLLYCVYVLKRLPHDYAKYHQSPAGRAFIENIGRVDVWSE